MAQVYRDCGLLESAAGRPFQSAFGKEIHRGIHAKGAALFHSLITNHPFGDGNKRTAVVSLQLFLLANGDLLLASQAEMYRLAISTASAGERHLAQTDLLRVIKQALDESTVTMSEIRKTKAYRKLCETMKQARRDVRTHPLNKQI